MEIVELQQAQERLTAIGEADTSEASHVNEIRSELGDAVDDLYQEVADDPGAAKARTWWRQCMAARGTAFDSPNAIEDAIAAPRSDVGEIDGHTLDVILANRDECEAEASELLSDLLAGRFPDWASEHAATIDEYRHLVEAASE